MVVYGVTENELLRAARTVGVSLDYSPVAQGRGLRLRLTTSGAVRTASGRLKVPPPYARRAHHRNDDGSRRLLTRSVCWHGHRDFFRALFELAPEARVVTAMATYRGREDFEASHEESGWRNIGSQMDPIYARDACDCNRVSAPSLPSEEPEEGAAP
jgi:hypothetical protein